MAASSTPLQESTQRPVRLLLLFAVTCLFALGIIGRLFYWQVTQAAPLQKKLVAQKTLDDEVPARRGAILDTNGDLLAGNLSVDFIYAAPNQIKRPEEVAEALAPILETPVEKLLPILADKQRQYVRLLGGRKVDPEVSEQIRKLRLPGIFLEPTTKRTYPEKHLAAHVLGFVDGESQGWYGLEGQHGSTVGGKPGRIRAERDTAGNEIGFSDRQWYPPEDGMDLVLTLDRTIQYIAERELDRAIIQYKAAGGTVVVMDPKTGAVLAMASRPAFDPNRYEEFASQTAVFANPAVTLLYEPGSTFKIFTMAAALNEKVVSPETTYNDTGVLSLGGFTIRNWDGKANGTTNMTQLLEKSSNIGASWVATRVGRDRFHKYVTAFGFGQPTRVDLQGEANGIVKDPRSRDWSDVDLATNSFGQAISVTPLQLTAAVASIANGGILMRPYLVRQVVEPRTQKVVRETQPQPVRQVVSRETATTLLTMLVSAVENGETRGALVPGYKVAGKTGTASIPDPVNGGYDPKLTIASFVGVVPVDDPQFVILVKIDKPQEEPWGSLVAKPAFGIIAQELTRYRALRPTEPIRSPTPTVVRRPTPAPTPPPSRNTTAPASRPAPTPPTAGR
jgi:cell division protein FtsI (penicillin-binding protein 3)